MCDIQGSWSNAPGRPLKPPTTRVANTRLDSSKAVWPSLHVDFVRHALLVCGTRCESVLREHHVPGWPAGDTFSWLRRVYPRWWLRVQVVSTGMHERMCSTTPKPWYSFLEMHAPSFIPAWDDLLRREACLRLVCHRWRKPGGALGVDGRCSMLRVQVHGDE